LSVVLLLISAPANARSAGSAAADDLPRHGIAGLIVGAADSAKPEDSQTNPPTVKNVVTGGPGEAAGILIGDTLLELDGKPVATAASFAQEIGRYLAGDSVRVVLQRAGQKMEKTIVLKPRPFETSTAATILYRSITAGGARRRTIITHPQSAGRHPAVLLIGGLGCYSLDGTLNENRGYGPILSALVKQGFVTMRVEKTGEGDSEGPACTDLKATAELEASGYAAALDALRSYDFVDPQEIFVFAHSLGPLLASLALPGKEVRGVIAAETIGRSWFEYTQENVRRQSALVGEPLDQVDAEVRAHVHCAYHFYLQHESSDEVAKLGKTCKEMITSNAGMPYPYMQQIGDINLARQWKQIETPVLVIYGTSDPATSADESRYLVGIINSFHSGNATYREIVGMGHEFGRYDSQRAFLEEVGNTSKSHPFDEELLPVVLGWLKQHLPS
jgi:alpha-beta hydrolase superfamily lysophospholipase